MNKLTTLLDAHLIDDWRAAFSKLSVQWNTLCIAAGPIWVVLSDEQKQAILSVVGVHPATYASAAFAISIVLRLARQSKKDEAP